MSNVVTVDFANRGRKAPIKPTKMLQDSWVMVGSGGSVLDMEVALNAYQRSLAYAAMDGHEEEFKKELVGIHYANHTLSVFWESAEEAQQYSKYVNQAWEDQGEFVTHFSYNGGLE